MSESLRKSLALYFAVMLIVSVLPSRGFGGETEAPVSSEPLCFGGIIFDQPVADMVITDSSGSDFTTGHYEWATIRRAENVSFLAEIFYGAPSFAPAAPENVPSTKIDLGSVIASVACIKKVNSQRTCHVSLIPVGTAGKPLIFLYHDLSEAGSAIADKMWRSAHRDERCKGTLGE